MKMEAVCFFQYRTRCGFGHNFTPCQSISSNETWTAICGYNLNPCRATLVLNITTEGDTGLYRCLMSHRNKTSKNFKVTQTYELEVVEIFGSPEILQGQPSNVTVQKGKPAVFQCRVHSKVRPVFYWLRRTDGRTSNDGLIPFLNDTYERMNSSGERELAGEVYISKLILPRSSALDNGYYTCLAVNLKGFQYRGAYLTVLTHTLEERTSSDSTPSSSLPLLFLIPAALVLIPIMVWMCCHWKQRRRRNNSPKHSQHDSIIINETRHHNNIPLHKDQGNGSGYKYTPVSTTGPSVSNDCQRNRSHTQYV
ncbi:fibroblast growth factor receptor-like 1 isoform X2 [Zootermopsis nevadensis]|uniref:fibroblast growth factor receptor-like 1 isoform X2 n=1 Tax=Zootermopsis nevadensis TaxID=136037 RepID=UPI000B8EB970|nr:fibroblast growth factor receptor-like 1 isoform X2 [Zootermopsis nevadensis]